MHSAFLGFVFIVGVLGPLQPANLNAGGGRVVILDGGKHRVLVIDRESRAVINENSEFLRVDCLSQLSPDELVICDRSQLVRVSLDLRERKRTQTSFERVANIAALGSDRWLISDTDRHAVVAIDSLGNELSSIAVHYPVDVLRFSNGRIIVADGTALLKTFDVDGTIVQQIRLRQWAGALDVARDSGDLLIGESSGYERLDAQHRRLWFRLSKSRITCIQELPGDEMLLCEPDLHRVAIVDRNGMIVWEVSNLEHPWRALYLP